MKKIFLYLLTVSCLSAYGQYVEMPAITLRDLIKKDFPIDTSAHAVVLLEKGNTVINLSEADRSLMVFHRYESRTKILDKEGYGSANIAIPLYTFGSTTEIVRDVKAITYNIGSDGQMVKTEIKPKDVFTETVSQYFKLTKFTLPDIKPGSVIEVGYTIISPDIFKFRTWEFQSAIPKLRSEYNAIIPAIFTYNVILRGVLKLKDTKSKVERDCLHFNGAKMDCSNITYIMEGVPAFIEEDYMLSPKNYISAIHFELEEAVNASGGKTNYTKNWSDVDWELMTDKDFGKQLKEIDYFKSRLSKEVLSINDKVEKAKAVYAFIQKNIKWNNFLGKYCQNGVRKSFENHSGNIGDVNFALTAALNAAGIEAYPVMVSTRDNVIPNNLHPVMSDFNYLITGVKINDSIILADASDPLMPFGEIPLRAINDRGRIIFSRKSSEWITLVNPVRSEVKYLFDGNLDDDGKLKGVLAIFYKGYEAYKKREQIKKYATQEEYEEKLDEDLPNIRITKLELKNVDDVNQELVETVLIEMDAVDTTALKKRFNFHPLFINRITKNPFNLEDRTYPIDVGFRKTESYNITIHFPKGISQESAPKNVNYAIPDNGAKYSYTSVFQGNVLKVSQVLSLNKAIYDTDEYFNLKELFSRAIQHQKIDYIYLYNTTDIK